MCQPQARFGIWCLRADTGLENDEYTRKTDGYLPTAEVAFIDEIFKANSAILNALLTLLNERLFDNGNQRLKVPLLCLVGARCSLHALTAQNVVAHLCTPRHCAMLSQWQSASGCSSAVHRRCLLLSACSHSTAWCCTSVYNEGCTFL